jgi:transmembrane protein 216
MPQRHDGQSILSLLALEILLYFNWWYSMLYIFANIIVFAYKGTWVAPFQKIPVIPSFSLTFPFSFCSGPHHSGFYLPYPPTALGWEVSFIFLYAIVEMIRLFQASKGNKTEQIRPLFWSLLLSISVIIANAYYIDMQTYVMRVDVILNVVSLSFVGLEFVLSLIAMIYFSRNVG